MIFLSNCSPTFTKQYDELLFEKRIEKYESCRGKGQLVSSGTISGKLSFSFTCNGDEVFIHFKDMLGRKTMMMILQPSGVEAWDIMQNIRFTTESIYLRFPFFEVLKPADLVALFWGYKPGGIDKINKFNSESEIDIRFSSNDLGLQTIFIRTEDKQTIEMTFEQREYGSTYPHLIRQIPLSIPQAQS